jgi:hypothetical protein
MSVIDGTGLAIFFIMGAIGYLFIQRSGKWNKK